MQFFGGLDISPSLPAVTASGNNANMMYIFHGNGVFALQRLELAASYTECAARSQAYVWSAFSTQVVDGQDGSYSGREKGYGIQQKCACLRSIYLNEEHQYFTHAEKGNLGVLQLPGQGCSFHSFHTNTYKLSIMESPSGIKIILVTHPRTGDIQDSLKYIYNLYIEYVAKNPLYTAGMPSRSETLLLTSM